MFRRLALIGFVVILTAALAFVLASGQSAQAQTSPSSLRGMLESLSGTPFVMRFASPVAGALDVSLSDKSHQIEIIGDDYVCFSEPWNDTRRTYCTPFANVTSVSFVNP